jgi:hypothetical protein
MFLRELSRWYSAQTAVQPDFVLDSAPLSDALPSLWQGCKPLLAQALVTKLAIEALNVASLHGLSFLNQDFAHAMRRCISHDGATGERRAICCPYCQRITPEGRCLIQ